MDTKKLTTKSRDAVSAALEVLVAQQQAGRVSLVLTVPEFLTAAHTQFLADHPGVGARRTSGVIADIAAGVVRELTVAAPFLAAVAVADRGGTARCG